MNLQISIENIFYTVKQIGNNNAIYAICNSLCKRYKDINGDKNDLKAAYKAIDSIKMYRYYAVYEELNADIIFENAMCDNMKLANYVMPRVRGDIAIYHSVIHNNLTMLEKYIKYNGAYIRDTISKEIESNTPYKDAIIDIMCHTNNVTWLENAMNEILMYSNLIYARIATLWQTAMLYKNHIAMELIEAFVDRHEILFDYSAGIIAALKSNEFYTALRLNTMNTDELNYDETYKILYHITILSNGDHMKYKQMNEQLLHNNTYMNNVDIIHRILPTIAKFKDLSLFNHILDTCNISKDTIRTIIFELIKENGMPLQLLIMIKLWREKYFTHNSSCRLQPPYKSCDCYYIKLMEFITLDKWQNATTYHISAMIIFDLMHYELGHRHQLYYSGSSVVKTHNNLITPYNKHNINKTYKIMIELMQPSKYYAAFMRRVHHNRIFDLNKI